MSSAIKAAFFDIDGTLVSFKTHDVPASTQEAIRLLQKNGVKIFVSTGRSIRSIDHVKYLDFDGYITFNGGHCITKEGDILFRQAIDPRDIQSLLDYSNERSVSFSLMFDDTVSINDVTKEIAGMYAHLNLPVPPLLDKTQVDTNAVLQTNIFISPEAEPEFMQKVMPNSIASRWTPLFADVNPKGQTKKTGLDIFCKHFGFDLSETIAFGDGGNDIAMLQHAKIGVAMGNANSEVKQVADFVTTDVDSDGIWNALKHYELI